MLHKNENGYRFVVDEFFYLFRRETNLQLVPFNLLKQNDKNLTDNAYVSNKPDLSPEASKNSDFSIIVTA